MCRPAESSQTPPVARQPARRATHRPAQRGGPAAKPVHYLEVPDAYSLTLVELRNLKLVNTQHHAHLSCLTSLSKLSLREDTCNLWTDDLSGLAHARALHVNTHDVPDLRCLPQLTRPGLEQDRSAVGSVQLLLRLPQLQVLKSCGLCVSECVSASMKDLT